MKHERLQNYLSTNQIRWQFNLSRAPRWGGQFERMTPNFMLFMQSNELPEVQPHRIQTADLRKRARHLLKCKQAMWSRWSKEYLRSLCERHRAPTGTLGDSLSVGDIVIMKSEDKDRGKWPLGIVEEIVGSDGVVRGARLRAGKSHVERAVQHLFPLELTCDRQLPAGAPVEMN